MKLRLRFSLVFLGVFLNLGLLFSIQAQAAINAAMARAKWLSMAEISYLPGSNFYSSYRVRFYIHTQVPTDLTLGQKVNLSQDHQVNYKWNNDKTYRLSSEHLKEQIPQLLRKPISLIVVNENDILLDITFFQLAGILDQLFYYEGDDLGIKWLNGTPQFKLWAPTAQRVRILVFDNSSDTTSAGVKEMDFEKGVWSALGNAAWMFKYYLYEVQVFSPYTARLETFYVVDPYSFSVGKNTSKSQIVDMDDPRLKPSGWDYNIRPPLQSFADIVIYETHIRDWTVADPLLGNTFKGTYLGMVQDGSAGFEHLKKLSSAGLTHIHFLPIYDFASVSEDSSTWKDLPPNMSYPSDSSYPQSELEKIKDQDAYNWGYDPVLYFTPSGAYSTNADGPQRILELRYMIMKLNNIGLRVIQDVVFNHSYQNESSNFSVFDKIVPLYYYRLNSFGQVHNSSCCADTASENRMMEKLIIDATKHWARNYKIEGFRFDLMNLHTRDNMRRVRDALSSLTLEKDRVDGNKIYIYGESWDFGSLEWESPEKAMFAVRTTGMGIGTFNDRMRDAVRGGTTNSEGKSDQGFITGLYYDFNKEPANKQTPGDMYGQMELLQVQGDVIRIGLAGNLQDYRFLDFKNNMIRGGDHYFRGKKTGYGGSPIEHISYVSAHDGYTLWDAIQAKMPFYTSGRNPSTATETERVRADRIALAISTLAQGVPFIEAGSDLLRSKSGDTDSYNSGDWFNRIDFSFNGNNWGVGLPVSWKNGTDWAFWKPRLAEPALRVQKSSVQSTARYFQALLTVRKSSPLFRLTTAADVQRHVSFPKDDYTNSSVPGLICMLLSNDTPLDNKDPLRNQIIVFFNATNAEKFYQIKNLAGRSLHLHPALDANVDEDLKSAAFDASVGVFRLPPRSTVIFEENK